MAITFNPNPMTELEAVNTMLLSIGKAPVNTLSVPGINDVSFATSKLYEVAREVQHRGWWFNREPKFQITPDGSGNILVPDSVIDFDVSDRTKNFVQRYNPAVSAMCLYDLDKHTFDLRPYIQGYLECDVVWCFPFEQTPQAARSYIARRAGREFQANVVGSQVIYQFTKEMELDAAAELERSELKNSHTNMFTAPTRNGRIFQRQPGAYRRSW